MTRTTLIFGTLLFTLLCTTACGDPAEDAPVAGDREAHPQETASMPRSASSAGTVLRFVSPGDGAVVTSPIPVEFHIEGMDVVRAGENVPNSGHHHLLIDTGMPSLDMPIPADEHHVHFGDGSTATVLELEPGEHSLQLLFADYLHVPHDPPVSSERIRIVVK